MEENSFLVKCGNCDKPFTSAGISRHQLKCLNPVTSMVSSIEDIRRCAESRVDNILGAPQELSTLISKWNSILREEESLKSISLRPVLFSGIHWKGAAGSIIKGLLDDLARLSGSLDILDSRREDISFSLLVFLRVLQSPSWSSSGKLRSIVTEKETYYRVNLLLGLTSDTMVEVGDRVDFQSLP